MFGVGVSDANYPVTVNATIDGRQAQLWICPFYLAWSNMITRCYSKYEHSRRPRYIGCMVMSEWHSFSTFRAWMLTQPWEGNQLDKDLLSRGNKLYGPDTCVFVPGTINNFLIDCSATRGDFPIGASWHKTKGKFSANCSNPFTRKLEHLGYFACPDAAHEAWRARKHQHACTYADMQSDPRIAQALRTRYATPAGEIK